MEITPYMLIVPIIVFLASTPAIIAVDRIRIRRNIAALGSVVLEIGWRPFKGSDLRETMLREYDVIHQDIAGRIHHCTCKIGLWSEVHMIDDKVIRESID